MTTRLPYSRLSAVIYYIKHYMAYPHTVNSLARHFGVPKRKIGQALWYYYTNFPTFKSKVRKEGGTYWVSDAGLAYLERKYKPRRAKPMQVAEEKYENIKGDLELQKLLTFPNGASIDFSGECSEDLKGELELATQPANNRELELLVEIRTLLLITVLSLTIVLLGIALS